MEPAHVEDLIALSFGCRHSDPKRGVILAREAVVLAGRSDLPELMARAYAYLGNALRVSNDLRGAEASFAKAWAHFPREGGSKLRLRILELQASLLEAMGLFKAAEGALTCALSLYGPGAPGLAASLLQRANVRGHSGQPLKAIRDITRAMGLIDPNENPKLAHGALHNLCWFLVDIGRAAEAQELALERATAPESGDELLGLRTRWLHSRIYAGLGCEDVAEAELVAVMDAFVSLDLPYEAAMVGLDLVQVQAFDLVPLTLTAVFSLLAALGVDREAEIARLLLYAIENAGRIRELIPGLVSALRRAHYEPGGPKISRLFP